MCQRLLETWKRDFGADFNQNMAQISDSPKNMSFMVTLANYKAMIVELGQRIEKMRDQVQGDAVLFRQLQMDISKIEMKLDQLDLIGWDEAVRERRHLLSQLSTMSSSFHYDPQAEKICVHSSHERSVDDAVDPELMMLYQKARGESSHLDRVKFVEGEPDAGSECHLWEMMGNNPDTCITLTSFPSTFFRHIQSIEYAARLILFVDKIFVQKSHDLTTFPCQLELIVRPTIPPSDLSRQVPALIIVELVCKSTSSDNQQAIPSQILRFILHQLVATATVTMITHDRQSTTQFLGEKPMQRIKKMLHDQPYEHILTMDDTLSQSTLIPDWLWPQEPQEKRKVSDRLVDLQTIEYCLLLKGLNDQTLASSAQKFAYSLYENLMDKLLSLNLYPDSELTHLHEKIVEMMAQIYFQSPFFTFAKHLKIWRDQLFHLFHSLRQHHHQVVKERNKSNVEKSEKIRTGAKVQYMQFLEGLPLDDNVKGMERFLGESFKLEDQNVRKRILKQIEEKLDKNFPVNWKKAVETDFQHEFGLFYQDQLEN